jgi:hypothetical protein
MSEAQRVESTPEYRAEFERLLAVGERLEKAFKAAKTEYERWERDMLQHIESRHFRPPPPGA